ncbi:MAG TPA: hypothetical protein VGO08_00270, partial [Burkholderiales bacterium]|nr:hypothetical protein [Burkholderiales bacterium]
MRYASLFGHAAFFELRQRLLSRGFVVSIVATLAIGGLFAYVAANAQTGAISPGMLSAGYKVTYVLLVMLLMAVFPIALWAAD